MKTCAISVLFLLLAISANGQNNRQLTEQREPSCSHVLPSRDGRRRSQQLLEDFDYFFTQLEAVHPDPYTAYGGKDCFKQKVDSLRLTLASTEDADVTTLQAKISRFLVPLHDGHTYCGFNNFANDTDVTYLPLDFYLITDGVIVQRATADYEPYIGSLVKGFNNMSIKDVRNQLMNDFTAENEYGVYRQFSGGAFNSAILKRLLPDFDGKNVSVSVTTPAGKDTTLTMPLLSREELQNAKKCQIPMIEGFPQGNLNFGFIDKGRQVMMFRCNSVNSRDCLEYMRDNGWDYQNVLDQYFNGLPIDSVPTIVSRFAAMLQEMKDAGAKHLIIDLRGNGGGFTPILYPTFYLMYGDKYLRKDFDITYETKISELYLKKNGITLEQLNGRDGHYKMGDFIRQKYGEGCPDLDDDKRREIINGYMCLDKELLHSLNGKPLYCPEDVYVITDAGTFSAAFHYTFMLWKMGATVVGTPSSQAPNTFMEVTQFNLPNTKIGCSVSNSRQVFFPSDDRRAKVFWPDWSLSHDDYKRCGFGYDAEPRYILDKIECATIRFNTTRSKYRGQSAGESQRNRI